MIIEIMYPAFILYGDRGNYEYLEQALPEADFHKTEINEEPRFVKEDVDLIYMGPMSEKNLDLALEHLKPHKERLKELLDKGCHFLIINTALELFGEKISTKAESKPALGLLPFVTKRDLTKRHASAILGQDLVTGEDVLGYDARFTQQYGNEDMAFLKVELGFGFHKDSPWEGIRFKNFLGTNLLGPILVMNPPLCKSFLKSLGHEGQLPFEETALAAYDNRRQVFRREQEFKNQAPPGDFSAI